MEYGDTDYHQHHQGKLNLRGCLTGLLSNQGEKSIKVWYSKAQLRGSLNHGVNPKRYGCRGWGSMTERGECRGAGASFIGQRGCLDYLLWGDACKGPKKHISISILWGYPYIIGLLYKGVYMGYPYPNFCLCAFLGPYCGLAVSDIAVRVGKGLRIQVHKPSTGHTPSLSIQIIFSWL